MLIEMENEERVTFTRIDISRIINDFRNSVPRINEEQERANRERILEHLRDTRMEENARFVVEGARIVCTQMEEERSVSRMRKLTDKERSRNTRIIGEARDNPEWYKSPSTQGITSNRLGSPLDQIARAKGAPRESFLARHNQRINADHMPDVINPSDRRRAAVFNQHRLLDKMDITFEPLFEKVRLGPLRELTESEPQSLTFKRSSIMNIPSAHQHFGTAMFDGSRCGTCKTSDDRKCCPDIEDLMWKGLNDSGTGDVNLAEYRTLLQNSAYMFCHHGQGLLYLDDSGQQLPVVDDLDEIDNVGLEDRLRRQEIKIMIDPGHGGRDPGAIGRGEVKLDGVIARHGSNGEAEIHESHLVLELGLAAQASLENAGFTVLMTRTTDVLPFSNDIDIDLNARGQLATDEQVDAFISIHFNAFDGSARGYETWIPTTRSSEEEFTKTFHRNILAIVPEGTPDRGIRQTDWTVFLPSGIHPRVLPEMEFIDNLEAMNRLGENWSQFVANFGSAVTSTVMTAFADRI